MEQSDYDEFLLFRPLDFLKIQNKVGTLINNFHGENYGFFEISPSPPIRTTL